jgi:hypothetical protein
MVRRICIIALLTSGCALFSPKQVILNPIEKTDIFKVPVGVKCGEVTTEKSGYFLSDNYIQDIAKARVK